MQRFHCNRGRFPSVEGLTCGILIVTAVALFFFLPVTSEIVKQCFEGEVAFCTGIDTFACI